MRRAALALSALAACAAFAAPARADVLSYERECGGTVDYDCWHNSCWAVDCFRYDCVVYADALHGNDTGACVS
jgi:hypothetical protein